MALKSRWVAGVNGVLGLILAQSCVLVSLAAPPSAAPLTFGELERAAEHEILPPALQDKVNRLMTQPMIWRNPSPWKPPGENKLRLAAWNIERGFQLSRFQQVLSTQPLIASQLGPQADVNGYAEKDWLAQSQVLLLSEVDIGMKRTQYQNIAQTLAKSLGMHAVYGVEFLELAPFSPQAKQIREGKLKRPPNFGEQVEVDPAQYQGLHGVAILTRYPVKKARVVRLPDCYDWYHGEQEKLTQLEKLRQTAADKIFLEDVLVEFRRGGRIALIADLAVPAAPNQTVTVVATHLENRGKPACRARQMETVLTEVKAVPNPVVIGGDWNTTGTDVSPTSVPKEVRKRLSNPRFLTYTALSLLTPYTAALAITNVSTNVVNYVKNHNDPATPHLPILLPNYERALFNRLKDFRFDDGTVLDLRGDAVNTFAGKTGFMGSSNQRTGKGFVPTFSLNRPLLKGWVGKYKLDWFVVKGTLPAELARSDTPVSVYPCNGRTLNDINRLYDEPLSDHAPITVDLQLAPPLRQAI
jgi:endonuclease/exonuclease/phosphatase family metal-dependent hydrolase